MRKCINAFTLIELMMVVLIIGIIAALSIPRFTKASAAAKKKEALGVLRQIWQLEHAYYMETGLYQPSTGNDSIPKIGFMMPSDIRRYYYTVEVGMTGSLQTSVFIVATEIEDTDLDGIPHERILMDEFGRFLGDFANN
jgi:prepilin-type N-terminal cleavage/methylation domain-containing protein